MTKDFLSAIAKRRTFYGIEKETNVTSERIQEIIEQSTLHTPSAFNSQSARVLVLLGEHHQKLWNITMKTLCKIVPAASFNKTEQKINSFAAGAGTILYFEDMTVVETFQKNFEAYKDNFPIWSQQSNGMLQLVIWTALELEGLGASLQHYNPLIDDEVKTTWKLPASWKLIAEMPFGNVTTQPVAKEFSPISERVKIFK